MPIAAYLVAISFVATLVRSTFGFGESLVAVPLFALVVPIATAVPLAVMISVLVAAIVVVQDRREIQLESAKWLVLFAMLGIPVGLAVLACADGVTVKLGLGALVSGYGVYSLAAPSTLHLERDSRAWLFACGFVSGVLGGAYGLNGPPLVVYGNLRRWSAQHFRATLQAYFLVASLLGVLGYAWDGLVGETVLRDFALCLPAVVPAVFIGRYWNRRLRGNAFYRYLYAGLVVLGGALIAATLAQR